MKRPNRRGTLSLDNLPAVAFTLIFVAAIMVGGYLVLAGLSTSLDTDNNVSTVEAGQTAIGNLTGAYDNVITYAPTWGTIIGVSVLIGIVIAGFAFGRSRGMF